MAMERDDIDTGKLFTIGIVGVILVLALGGLVQVLYYQKSIELDEMRNIVPQNRQLAEYQLQQRERLQRYGWVDQGNAVAAIPIERAMSVTVAEMQKQRQTAPAAPASKTAEAPQGKL